MDKTQLENLKRMTTFLKDQPGYMQNLNLLILCKSGLAQGASSFEKIARILAEYGIPAEKVFPCIMDIMMAMAEEEVEKGQHLT